MELKKRISVSYVSEQAMQRRRSRLSLEKALLLCNHSPDPTFLRNGTIPTKAGRVFVLFVAHAWKTHSSSCTPSKPKAKTKKWRVREDELKVTSDLSSECSHRAALNENPLRFSLSYRSTLHSHTQTVRSESIHALSLSLALWSFTAATVLLPLQAESMTLSDVETLSM